MIDGPTTGVARCVYPVKRLSLTNFKLDLFKGARTGTVRKAVESFGLEKKFADSARGKKIAQRTRRANLNDFERFHVALLRKQRSYHLAHKK